MPSAHLSATARRPRAADPAPGAGPRARRLPAPPSAALRVLHACTDPRSDASRLAAVVEQDPALTANVLRVVNSAFFGLVGEVTSVRHAVSVLGHRGLRNYVLCIAVRDALSPAVLHGVDTNRFWHGALYRAVSGRALARAAGVDADTAFTACLLQDIGLLVMLHEQPAPSGELDGLLELDPRTRLERERAIFGVTHDVAGRELGEAWQLPGELVLAIGHHHRIDGDVVPDDAPGIVRVAACADWMAAVFLGREHRHDIARARAVAERALGLEATAVDALLEELSAQVGEAAQALGVPVAGAPAFEALLREANLVLAQENLGYQELAWRLQRALDENEAVARRLRDEAEKARIVQRALLPAARGARILHGINLPARELSGDFFDYFEIGDGRWCFALGDVSGKGMDAALLMSRTASLFRCLGKRADDPGRLLGALNDELCELSVRGMFVTMASGIFDAVSGTVAVANAGHPPALIVDDRGGCEQVEAGAPPLGVLAGVDVPSRSYDLDARSLYLYSDGLMEAASSARVGASPEALLERIGRLGDVARHERPMRLVNALMPADARLADDLTVLLLDPRA